LIESAIIEILGRPITLEDVLRTLEISTKGDGDSWYYIDKYGDFRRMDKDDVYCNWVLGLSLDDQSEETIKWLNDNIK
jgi:hypothetical protein